MLATPPNMSLMPFRGFERNRCGPRPLLVHRLPQHPLGDTPDSAVSEGFVIRCTAPAAVNVRAALEFERC